MKKLTFLFVLLAVYCSSALAQTTFEKVFIAGNQIKQGAIVGGGIDTSPEISSGPLKDSKGHSIEWRVNRDEVDELGMRHVFYRQYLVTPVGDALIVGTEVGFHYAKDGTLRSASGRQVTSLSLANQRSFGLAEASDRVLSAVRRSAPPKIDRGKLLALTEPELMVVTIDGVSRLAFELALEDGAGLPYQVAVDAANEQILRVTQAFAGANCEPTTPLSVVSAVGVPLRSSDGVSNRSLSANATGGRPAAGSILTHEAYSPAQWNLPALLIFQQTQDSTWTCVTDRTNWWTLLPLRVSGGSPRYDDFGDVWRGREAADAMHHTNLTMEVFRSLGRNGWDGSGREAKVTIDAHLLGTDNAFFSRFQTTHSQQGVVVLRRNQISHGLEAALDVIAHEWGHGVVFTSAGLPYDDFLYPEASQLHEGFADVIGHIVEKMMQPGGFGLERSGDWEFGEDAGVAGGYIRSASTDDGAGPFRYHRYDSTGGAAHHNWGNMLGVAFYVLSDGASNPWCASNPSAFGCNAATPGLGQDVAARVMFRALTHYVTSTAEWDDIADKVKLAAADLYHNCYASENRNAEWEQEQVEQAFLSIGYPSGLGSFEFCPIVPEW